MPSVDKILLTRLSMTLVLRAGYLFITYLEDTKHKHKYAKASMCWNICLDLAVQ